MKLPLLILVLLYSLHGYSQHGYYPGFIVKLDGNTEEGLINSRSGMFNAKRCEFKKNAETDPVVYLPGDIAGYRLLDGKYFVSKRVLIDNIDTTLFLESLISGKISIYYTEWESHDHFYLETEGEIVELKNNKSDRIYNGVDYKVRSEQYKGVLKYVFRDCSSISQKLDRANFSKKSLTQLGREYLECICDNVQCITHEKQFAKKRFSFGADFSAGLTEFVFTGPHVDMSIKPVPHFQFGVSSQMNLDEEGRFNFQAALRYYSHKAELFNDMKYSVGAFPSDVHYQYSLLKPDLQLKYKYKIWKIVPFTSAGIFTNIFLSDKGYIRNERFDVTIPFTTNGGGEYKRNGSMNGGFGALGEIGFETPLKPGNLSFSFFYEHFLTRPFRATNNSGIRCGYFFYF